MDFGYCVIIVTVKQGMAFNQIVCAIYKCNLIHVHCTGCMFALFLLVAATTLINYVLAILLRNWDNALDIFMEMAGQE